MGARTFPCNKDRLRWVFNPLCYPRLTCDYVVTKVLDVAAAEYGLGAFSTQSIKKGTFIGGNALVSRGTCSGTLSKSPEYVGEIYHTSDHTSRTYVPSLFLKLTNETRTKAI